MLAAGMLTVSCKLGDFSSTWNQLAGDAYPLDSIDRAAVFEQGKLVCPEISLIDYTGSSVKFVPPLRITPPFGERLRLFEETLVEVSKRHFGRAPTTVGHAGAYVCRSVEHRKGRYSEHALGNALDVVSFGYESAASPAQPPVGWYSPDRTRTSFRVDVARHWHPTSASEGAQGRFLRDLIDALLERDVFRSVLGPGAPGHDSHFHFDMAPWGYVDIEAR